MKNYIIELDTIVNGQPKILYHENISITPRSLGANNIYTEHVTSDIKKAMKFYDAEEAYRIGKLFESDCQKFRII